MRFIARFAVLTLCLGICLSKYPIMQTIKNDSQGGRGIQMIPRSGTYQNVVLWFHGLGDTADGWASMMPSLDLASTKYILPTAPNRPISLNQGSNMPGWSDIFGLDSTSAEDSAGFNESAARITSIIQAEIDKGIPSTKIIIGGFSQGGALALHVALRSPVALGGCVALSSWLPLRGDYPAALSMHSRSLPILQVHGNADRVVSYEWGHGTHQLLKTLVTDTQPRFVKIDGMGHSSDPEEMVAVKNFLTARLSSSA